MNLSIGIMKDNKIIQTLALDTFDWCGIIDKNGRIPTKPGWKMIMKGFGKYFRNYMHCPIKRNVDFNKIFADPKMLLFAPPGRAKFRALVELFNEKGQKDFVNFSVIAESYN
ncbi:hypothetical protein ACKWTF_000383 [Chironomus riparius]